MFSRPDISILLITDTTVLRADFAGARKPRMVHRWQRQIGVEASLTVAADIAFGFNDRIGRNVIVLSSAVWTQLVSVASISIMGMESEELQQALKFEVEALSGIEVDDAALAVKATREIDGQQQFWVAELSARELEEVVNKAMSRGARTVRVGHPAVCPGGAIRPLSKKDDRENDESLEFWPNLVCRTDDAEQRPFAISQSDTRGSRWTSDVGWNDVNDIGDSVSILAGPDVIVPELLSGHDILSLDDEAVANAWLTNWASMIHQELPSPMLDVPRSSNARQLRFAGAALIAILVAGLCFWQWKFTERQTAKLTSETRQLQLPAQEQGRLAGELSSLHGEKNKLEVESTLLRQNVADVEFLLKVQNKRFEALLELLLDLRTDDMVIEQIETNELGLKVSGVSIYGQSAPLLATQLRNAVMPLGWEVNPPTQTGGNQMTSGGPFKFELILKDVGPNVATRVVNRVASQ